MYMLTQIFVKDFVLIDNMNIEFADGMSAFTGETGAGKSLLIDAIGILRGDRINTSMVKQGKEKAIIEGIFTLAAHHPARKVLADAGYELEEDTLVIQREFNTEGKSISRMNHRTTTVALIREVLSTLIDIHSQHDSQYLLNTKYHLSLLDSYCAEASLCEEVASLYHHYHKAKQQLADALQNDYNEDDLDMLTYQLNEIDEAAIQEGELEELEDEQRKLMAFEKTSTNLHQVIELLNGDQGANPSLYEACRQLEPLHEDEELVEAHDKLLELYYILDEQYTNLYRYLDAMEYDEARANQISERIFLIHKILRKYGGDPTSVANKRADLERKIDSILHRADFIKKMEELQQQAYDAFYQKAKELQQIRMKKANDLEKHIVHQLRDLHLENAQFHIAFHTIEGNAHGIDQVEFLISMNKGEALKPLQTTASGGELSRLMLGLKTIFTQLQGIETIIFDEIDTGVSGSVAFAIGQKMKQLAQSTQVFCVTHLAQVAACANHHYLVEKKQDASSTTTMIRELEEHQRIEQLARIASDSTSTSALSAARELYEKANSSK